ncbi:hypothetical protein ACFZAO_05475 [Streptomyces griseoaurantiacus]|uniref:hypothetical protein n=1 Tax=Streptomyces griseoaurantiacus TaxID=68213 RepID=UPI0036F0F364
MGLFSNSRSDTAEYKRVKREHEARFNNRDTDPDSPEFRESNKRVSEARQKVGWLRRG